jgi:gliding-associated putative ABC transporter substrate-binding component GldG
MADNNHNSLIMKGWVQFLSAVAGIIIIAYLCSLMNIRLDLTEDKRYSLSEPTIAVLTELKNDIFIQVYLDGEMPVPLKRLRRSVKDMLDEFRIASGRKIDYQFINPSENSDSKQRESLYQNLIEKGLAPINLQAADGEGGSTQKILFPGMIVNYNGIEVPVNFLKNDPGIPYEQNILHSVEALEYEMIQTISTISSGTIRKIAFIEGHGEISEIETASITLELAKFFTVDRGTINGTPGILDGYSAVIVAGPENEFNEADKLVLDQYIMHGGKVLWLIEEVAVNMDSLATGQTAGIYKPLNVEDQLFRYGVRVNPAIIQDLDSWVIRVNIRTGSNQQQFVALPWLYSPLLRPSNSSVITRNLNRVKGDFTNFIDTVGLDPAIKKTVLLSTSEFARTISPPVIISLKEAELKPDNSLFNRSSLPVAVLLEGVFTSAFRNRMISSITGDKNFKIKTESVPTRMIVVADADIIRNEVKRSGLQETFLPLGEDKYTRQVFGNRDFIVNSLNYLVDNNGIMELRSREIKLRLLNMSEVKASKLKWQLINIAGPVLIVVLAGFLYNYFRKRRFTRF